MEISRGDARKKYSASIESSSANRANLFENRVSAFAKWSRRMQVTHTARKSKNEFAAGDATCIKRGAISTVRDFICGGERVAALINPGE
jgi:hypothetical protein